MTNAACDNKLTADEVLSSLFIAMPPLMTLSPPCQFAERLAYRWLGSHVIGTAHKAWLIGIGDPFKHQHSDGICANTALVQMSDF